jgi:hypothetical protein
MCSLYRVVRISGICLAIVGQDGEAPRLCDAEPCTSLFSLQVSRREDLLAIRRPPMRPARGTEDEFIAVVKYDQSVRRVGSGKEDNTHFCGVYIVVI